MNKNILNLLKDNILYLIFVFAVLIGGSLFLYKKYVKNIITNTGSLRTKQEALANSQRELDALKETIEKKKQQEEQNKKSQAENAKSNIDKPIFKTDISGGDSFSSNTPLFEDVIKIIKANKLKLVSIENKVSGFDDPLSGGGTSPYNTCLINMQLLGTYAHLQKFLSYMYDYPYLVNIDSLEVIPFDKDKNMLIINLALIFYSEYSAETDNWQ